MTEFQHSRVPEQKCPDCGAAVDAATPLDGESIPKEGSAAICLYCSGVAIYDENLSLRQPTPEEQLEIASDVEIIRAIQVVRGKGPRFKK